MNFPEPSVWMRHRISYGETDAMGVLYYAEYLHIFERARSTYSRACGCSYDEIEKGGINPARTRGAVQIPFTGPL